MLPGETLLIDRYLTGLQKMNNLPLNREMRNFTISQFHNFSSQFHNFTIFLHNFTDFEDKNPQIASAPFESNAFLLEYPDIQVWTFMVIVGRCVSSGV